MKQTDKLSSRIGPSEWFGYFVLAAVAVLVISAVVFGYSRSNGPSVRALATVTVNANQLTLYASPGNGSVQIFDGVGIDAQVIKALPHGTQCKKLDGPIAVNLDGVQLSLYKVSCAGTIGYVNSKWAR